MQQDDQVKKFEFLAISIFTLYTLKNYLIKLFAAITAVYMTLKATDNPVANIEITKVSKLLQLISNDCVKSLYTKIIILQTFDFKNYFLYRIIDF